MNSYTKPRNESSDGFNKLSAERQSTDYYNNMVSVREEKITELNGEIDNLNKVIFKLETDLVIANSKTPLDEINLDYLPSEYYGEDLKSKIKKVLSDYKKGYPIFYTYESSIKSSLVGIKSSCTTCTCKRSKEDKVEVKEVNKDKMLISIKEDKK